MNPKQTIIAMCILLLAGRAAFADEAFDQKLFRAVRYATTAEKLKQKEDARKEILAGRAESLRGLMRWIHVDNPGVPVLTQELVDQLKARQAVPVLLEFIGDERPETRKMAVYYLGFYDAPDRADAIMPLLSDEKTRGATIRTLGKWKVAKATLKITPYLKDDNERIRVAAANALRDIGDPRAIPFMIDALGDPVFTVRNTAQRALVSFGKSEARPLLLALDTAHDPARRELVRALGEMKANTAVPYLRPLLNDGDPGMRYDAAQALQNMPRGWMPGLW